MGNRVVNGNTHSENGWPLVDQGSCRWVLIPGSDDVWLEIQDGEPAIVMAAFAADVNRHVEKLRDADSACWTATNDVLGQPGRNNGSNHLGGTGMDLNWQGADGRTFRLGIPLERAWPGDKARKLYELLDFYEGLIFCGGEWSIRDWMHFQMGGNTYRNARVADFIRRKIRPDGFSTFMGGQPGPVPSVDRVALLAKAMGNVKGVNYAELLPHYSNALVLAKCDNNNRIAMASAQLRHESNGFYYMKEVWGPTAQQLTYQGRMGNDQPGDGERYMGRGPVQVTGKNNYRALSKWAHERGYVDSPTYFVDHPQELERYEHAFMGFVWWWETHPRILTESDRGDVDRVSKLINMPAYVDDPNQHPWGEQKRRDYWNQCRAMDLMPLVQQAGGFLMALSDAEQRELLDRARQIWGALMNVAVPSKSRYGDPKDLWAVKDLIQNMDGFLFDFITEHDAALGDSAALARVQKAANAGDQLAVQFLRKLQSGNGAPVVISNVPTSPVPQTFPIPPYTPPPAVKPNTPPNDMQCWKCGKQYPSVLLHCPFCGAQTGHAPAPVAAPLPQTTTVEVSEYSPPPTTSLTLLPEPPERRLSVDPSVIDQMQLLLRFAPELPSDMVNALEKLVPKMQELVDGESE